MALRRRKQSTVSVSLAIATCLFFVLVLRNSAALEPWQDWEVLPESQPLLSPTDIFKYDPGYLERIHPIDGLIKDSSADFQRLLDQPRGDTLADSAALYRERRGRHPPPGYDEWYQFAKERDAVMIEDLFDQIYRDIEPFWGQEPARIRRGTRSQYIVKIRNGTATSQGHGMIYFFNFVDLFEHLAPYLPDIDIPINHMDEPRIFAPWDDVHEMMKIAEQSKHITSPPNIQKFGSFEEPQGGNITGFSSTAPLWDTARLGCNPETPGRWAPSESDYSSPPVFPTTWPNGTHQGYVSNWTIAKSPCHHSHIPSTHGTFVNPLSISTASELIPMFSQNKIPMSNDIVIPSGMQWVEDNGFTAPETFFPWEKKRNEVFWRGSASGGRNTPDNWRRFQRHRFLSMLNETHVRWALDEASAPAMLHESPSDYTEDQKVIHEADQPPQSLHNFPLPSQDLYPLLAHAQNLLPEWIRTVTNTAFTFLQCHPWNNGWDCPYTDTYYRRGVNVIFPFTFQAKYLPDIDGNGFSGRYRAFILSNSLPIKATIYEEWFDDRLFPWVHFVPIDNGFGDLWGVLEYFFGRDEEARKIAEQGREWGNKVLRKEDMLIYVYRLVLEFKRVCSEGRDEMGWDGLR